VLGLAYALASASPIPELAPVIQTVFKTI